MPITLILFPLIYSLLYLQGLKPCLLFSFSSKCKLHDSMAFFFFGLYISSLQSLSCVWLCDPMNRSTPGLPVHHQLPEFTQTHVHQVGDAIQPSHPPWSPSPPALNLSKRQGLFKWVSSLHQVAKVLEFQLQHHILSIYSTSKQFLMLCPIKIHLYDEWSWRCPWWS